MLCNILSNELVGVVARVGVIAVSRVPTMELTLKSPKPPLLAASRSIRSTSLSLTVELKLRARSTIILPHLGRKTEKISTNLFGDFTEREIVLLHKFSDGRISQKKRKRLFGLKHVPVNKRVCYLFDFCSYWP